MSKANETRENIIRTVAPIFNKKGYSGTSFSNLIKATGLSKGSFYGNFESKNDIAIAVYEYNISMLIQRIDTAVFNIEKPVDKLYAILNYYDKEWKSINDNGGCPIMNASLEVDDNLPLLRGFVKKNFKKWVKRFADIIEEGKSCGDFNILDSTSYSYSIIMLLEGGILFSKLNSDKSYLNHSLDRIKKIIREEILI